MLFPFHVPTLGTPPIGQVRLLKTHPLAVGLRIAYIFQQTGQSTIIPNLADPTHNGVASGVTFNSGNGQWFNHASVGSVDTGLMFTKIFTVVVSGYRVDFSADYVMYVNEDTPNYIEIADAPTSRAPAFFAVDGTLSGAHGTVTETGFHKLGLTRAGDSLTNGYSVYQNGRQTGQANTGVYTASKNILIGHRPGTTQNLGGYIRYVYIWNRCLMPSEMAQIAADPYQILVPALPFDVASPVAGGGGHFRRTLSELGARSGSRQRVG